MKSAARTAPNIKVSQGGFSLIEVMTAAMVLSVFIVGIGGFWVVGDQQANEVVLREKAVLIANGEMERLSALYNNTGFGFGGASTTTGYESSSPFPTTRLTYPTTLDPLYTSAADDYVTTSAATFGGNTESYIWVTSQLSPALNRSYVWLDGSQNIMGRISWVVSTITPSQCVVGTSCVCKSFSGMGTGSCQRLDLFLEYPFRLVSNVPVAGANLDEVALSTIVGRQT